LVPAVLLAPVLLAPVLLAPVLSAACRSWRGAVLAAASNRRGYARDCMGFGCTTAACCLQH
jgi:hypothetical protein